MSGPWLPSAGRAEKASIVPSGEYEAVSPTTTTLSMIASAAAVGCGSDGTATTLTLPPLPFFVEDGTTTSCLCEGERMTVCSALLTVGRLRGDEPAIGAQSGFAFAGQT